jgi:hypothetical protein
VDHGQALDVDHDDHLVHGDAGSVQLPGLAGHAGVAVAVQLLMTASIDHGSAPVPQSGSVVVDVTQRDTFT